MRALHFTLAFVIDLPRGDDFVEHSGERLVLSDDSRRDERRHDELPLTDVGFHGYPGREASGEQVTNKQTNKREALWIKMHHYPSSHNNFPRVTTTEQIHTVILSFRPLMSAFSNIQFDQKKMN